MPQPPFSRLARTAAACVAGSEWSDGRLIGRYVAARDEIAFAGLVARHGPMVLAVCRRVAGDTDLADDAFQAAFMVLARRAAVVSPREAVRGWLYGVAVRTAREARRMAARRRRREVPVPAVPDRPGQDSPPMDADTLRVLDEEIARLSEALRAAVVLCELDGLSRRDAAARLGVPEGTVSSRLARARTLLAARLKGRGVTAPVAALAVSAPVPVTLAAAAAKLGGASPPSAMVSELTREVFRTMLLSKLKLAILPVTAVALTAGVIIGAAGPIRSDDPSPPPAAAAKPTAPPAVPRFADVRTTGPGKLLVERNEKLWLANPDGTRPVSIDPPAGTVVSFPRLSPDHRWAAFFAFKPEGRARMVGDPRPVPPDRVVVRDRLDRKPDFDLKLDGLGVGLAWSPDGTRLIACVASTGREEFTTWLIDPVAGSKTRLPLPAMAWVQDWSRDGKTLLATVVGPERKWPELRLLGLDGKDQAVLTTLSRFEPGAALSPDGTQVLFTDGDPDEKVGRDEFEARLHLYLLDVKRKARTRVAAVPKEAFVRGCAWSPEGRRFAFTWKEVHPGLNKKLQPADDLEVDTKSYLAVCDADGTGAKTVVTEKALYSTERTLGAIDWR